LGAEQSFKYRQNSALNITHQELFDPITYFFKRERKIPSRRAVVGPIGNERMSKNIELPPPPLLIKMILAGDRGWGQDEPNSRRSTTKEDPMKGIRWCPTVSRIVSRISRVSMNVQHCQQVSLGLHVCPSSVYSVLKSPPISSPARSGTHAHFTTQPKPTQ
jgi:hypothetical protein